MKYVKLTTKEGTSWDTAVNPEMDNGDIKDYFMLQSFNVSSSDEEEKMEIVSKVEFLYIANFKGRANGAIGIKTKVSDFKVWGEDVDSASLNIYNDYDSIQGLQIHQSLT